MKINYIVANFFSIFVFIINWKALTCTPLINTRKMAYKMLRISLTR